MPDRSQVDFQNLRPKSLERLMPTVFKALSSEPGGGNPFTQFDIVEMRATEEVTNRPGIYRVRYPDMAYIVRPYERLQLPGQIRQALPRRQFELHDLPHFEARMRQLQPQTAWVRVADFVDRTHPRQAWIHFDLYIYMGEGTYTVDPFEEQHEKVRQGDRPHDRRAGA